MGGPTFLTLSQVHRLHARALAEHGGQEGVREPGLVDSALASAKNTFWYVAGDLFDSNRPALPYGREAKWH